MSIINRYYVLIFLAFVLSSGGVSAQVVEIPEIPEPIAGGGTVLTCYVATAPTCNNFVAPIAGLCDGDCVVSVHYPPGGPPEGVIVYTCPQTREESYKPNVLVMRARALTSMSAESGLDNWTPLSDVACISYDYCLCILNPAGTGMICDPCGCGHDSGLVEQSSIGGSVCNDGPPGG